MKTRPRTVPPTIRKATEDDAEQVAAVINHVIAAGRYTIFDRPFSISEEKEFISSLSRRSVLFVAEAQSRIIGVQSLDLFSGFAASVQHVATMGTWLHRDFRGSGLGRRLAEASFGFARERDYLKIVIEVLADNDRALCFYRGLGFRDIGTAKRQVKLNGRFHDEIYLEKIL